MDNRRYRVGDKVRIVQYNPHRRYRFGFVEDMRKFCGKIMTIKYIYDATNPAASEVEYYLVEDTHNYMWSLSMFEMFTYENFINLRAVL